MLIAKRVAEYKAQMKANGGNQAAALAYIDKNLPMGGASLSAKDKLKALFGKNGRGLAAGGYLASILGATWSAKAMSMGEDTQDERNGKARLTFASSLLTGVGMGSMFGPAGAIIGGAIGSIAGMIQAEAIKFEDAAERAARLNKELESAKNENIAKKNEFKELSDTVEEYEKLKDARLENADSMQQYLDKSNEIAQSHPDLVEGYDAEGNAILNLAAAYEQLRISKEGVSETEKAEADATINVAKNAVNEAEKAFLQQK